MTFSQDSCVAVRQIDANNWTVLIPYSYFRQVEGWPAQVFSVPEGMPTDFASVPRPLTWLLPRYGMYTRAAIVHDYLWRIAVPAGRLTRRDADHLFRTMLRDLDVAFWRRWAMWGAVRLGALAHRDGRKSWWRDAPKVAVVAVVLVPVIAVPAVAILLALTMFFVIEAVTLPFLKLGRKRVNTPSLLVKQ